MKLIKACQKGKLTMIEHLLYHGADINVYEGKCLMAAIHGNHQEAAMLLLKHGIRLANSKCIRDAFELAKKKMPSVAVMMAELGCSN